MTLHVKPITIRAATGYVAEHHRHSAPPRGAILATSVCDELGQLHGVGMLGRPVAHPLQDGYTAEVLRVCTDGTANACSMLYGALRRAARALGYRRVVTYTLESEPGTSLRAAGFVLAATLPARESWSTPSRPRAEQHDLFGRAPREVAPRLRWQAVV